MIQRKQSIWLLLAALFSSGVFFLDLFRVHTMVNGVDTVVPYRTDQHFPILIIAIVMVAVPLINIFMFKDRKRQIRLAAAGIIAIGSFLTKVLLDARVEPPATVTYWVGAVLPVISLVFLVLAIIGIRKDEKLVRSIDRLR